MALEDAQAAYRRLRLTHDLTTAIADASSVSEALASTLQIFCEAGDWVVGQVWLPDGDTLECAPVWYQRGLGFEAFHDTSVAMRFGRGEPLVGLVWQRSTVTWAEDITDHSGMFRRADAAAAAGLRTALWVPVVSDGEVKAILEFMTRGHLKEEPGLRDLIATAATQLGSLIARKEAETNLRYSEARFRAVTETAHDAIVSMDATGTMTYVNAEALRLLDQPEDKMIGAPVTTIIPERFHQAHWAGLSRYLATGESRLIGSTVTLWARRQDGSEVPVELSLSTWQVEGSQHFTAIMRDVSERQRTHDELERALVLEREAAERLRELDSLKNTFLDAVSHDLRTPLAAIRAVTSVLQGDADSRMLTEEQRRTYLLGLQANVDKIRALLDDLLDLERLVSGDLVLNRSPVDLASLIERWVAEHRAALGDRTVGLDVEPVVAEVDAVKVERIFENLLLNAARHTPEGTSVRVSLQQHDSEALLTVDDCGPGVPESMREVIFERFRQADRSAGAGLGIGLSLVARFAELHGGRAWVEECPGGGASFRVLLPLHTNFSHEAGVHV